MGAKPVPHWALRLTLPLILSATFVGGLLGLGQYARDWVGRQDRFSFAFADIECAPPPPLTREAFLGEVQYLAGFPDQAVLLDGELSSRLAAAFARHPWVEKVEKVEVTPPGRVSLTLRHRTPVLTVVLELGQGKSSVTWVALREGPSGDAARAPARVVDADGVLLPAAAKADGLPLLRGCRSRPTGPGGAAWGDPAVRAAARTAAFLRPHQAQLQVREWRLTREGLVGSSPRQFRVLWGQPPAEEKGDEPKAEVKVERLLEYCRRHGGLARPAPQQHDVRTARQPLATPLAFGGLP
jgi:hypothetical protein